MTAMEAAGVRERILETAARLFVGQGYRGISMREIADACGLSKAGLYYHFKDKEDLFLAILAEHLAELGRLMAAVEQQPGSAPDRIRAFVRAIFTQLPAERRAIIRLATQEMSQVSPAARTDFGRRYEALFTGRLARILAEGVAAGELRPLEPHRAVWALLGLMYPFFHTGAPAAEDNQEGVIELIQTIFLEGVKHRDGTY